MTLDEIKKEADKLGYRVLKKTEPLPTLIPCACGCNRRTSWWKSGVGEYYACKNCGFESEPAITERGKRQNWNDAIKAIAEV